MEGGGRGAGSGRLVAGGQEACGPRFAGGGQAPPSVRGAGLLRRPSEARGLEDMASASRELDGVAGVLRRVHIMAGVILGNVGFLEKLALGGLELPARRLQRLLCWSELVHGEVAQKLVRAALRGSFAAQRTNAAALNVT